MNERLKEALEHAKALSETKNPAPMLRNCPKDLWPEYQKYRKECVRITRKVKREAISGYDTRPFVWCVDHKVSILYGFLHKIPAEDLCRPSNLHIVTKGANSTKRNGCIFEGTELTIDERTRRHWEIRNF